MVEIMKRAGFVVVGLVSLGISEKAIAAQDIARKQIIRGVEISSNNGSVVYKGWASYYTKSSNGYSGYNKPNDHISITSETNYRFNEDVPMAAVPLWMLYDLGIYNLSYLSELEVKSLKTGKKLKLRVMDGGGLLGEMCKNVTSRDPEGQCGRIIDLNKASMRLLGHSPEEGIIEVEFRVTEKVCDSPTASNKLPNCKVNPKRAGELIAQTENRNRLGINSDIAHKSVEFLTRPIKDNQLLDQLGNSISTPIEVGLGLKGPKTERDAWALNLEVVKKKQEDYQQKSVEFRQVLNQHSGSILERLRTSRDKTLEVARAIDNYQIYEIQFYQTVNQQVEQQNYINQRQRNNSSSQISGLLMFRQ